MLPWFLIAFFGVQQGGQTPSVIRTPTLQVMAPHGWEVREASSDIWLQHASGASLRVIRSRQGRNLERFAYEGVERIMRPLGFAKFEGPRSFKDSEGGSLQYEIRGNRLSERRRILYRAVQRKENVIEILYENSEDRFDILLSEAQGIASSLELVVERPLRPAPRRGAQSLK
jgi:hypothetical protein